MLTAQTHNNKEMKLLTLLTGSLLLAIPKTIFMPDLGLISWLGFALIIDLVSGIWKAVVRKEARTSKGLQQTVNKFIKYFGAILISLIVRNVMILQGKDNPAIMDFLSDSLLVFLVYIEVVSILENLIALDKTDSISRFLFIPFHNLLTFQIRNMFTKQDSKDPEDEIK